MLLSQPGVFQHHVEPCLLRRIVAASQDYQVVDLMRNHPSKDQTITILTSTPEPGWPGWKLTLRTSQYRTYHILRHLLGKKSLAGGPKAVRHNLLVGLKQTNCPFLFNPLEIDVTPWVGVLSDPTGALSWAIRAKREGRIRHLVAGPNLVVTPAEHAWILTTPAIDLVVTPSKWVSEMYLDFAPNLAGRLVEWPVGVDERYWRPEQEASSKKMDFLVYDKIRMPQNRALVSAVTTGLAQRGLSFEMLEYGTFEQKNYRQKLRTCRAMVYLTETESQGIALFEAWACDVPTLVWDQRLWEWESYQTENASSAPYLTPKCGLRFRTPAEFSAQLDEFWTHFDSFTPREFVLDGFTQSQSAKSYLKLFEASARDR